MMLAITTLVVGTAVVISVAVFPQQEATIREKAFDVCEVSAMSISSAAGEALLTDQVVLLDDIVRSIRSQNIEGLREVSVIFKDRYFVHSQADRRGTDVEDDVLQRAKALSGTSGVKRQEILLPEGGEKLPAFEFLTPIRFQDRVIGYSRIVYDADAIQAPIRRARWIAALVSVGTLSASFVAVIVLSGRLARPILQVAEAARRVGTGDLDVHLEIHTLDELGTLADRFNHMVDEIKEKLQMSKFVSGSTVQMIRDQRNKGDVQLGGVRQDLAFFFSDVRGFTAWSEKTPPENVVQVLNEYLDLQTQIVKRFGGDIDKYVGDEIMAVFSGPDKDDHCLTAAVAVVQNLKKFNEIRTGKGLTALNVGIGCHSGEVIVGNMGSRDRMDFTAIGDVVNLSARLCSAAEALQVVTTKEMLAKAKRRFRIREMEAIRVKGKVDPIEIAGVLGVLKETGSNQNGNAEDLSVHDASAGEP